MKRIPSIVTGLVVIVFCAIVTIAQVTSGTIFGTVMDSNGATIRNATVKITNARAGVERTVLTNETGAFVAPNLPPGTYEIIVEAPGFKRLVKTNVFLSATDRLNTGNFTLEVGGTT